MEESPKLKVNIHQDLCFCGSGRFIRDCCFAPINTTPPGARTGFSHPKCYAKALEDCSTKITNEHLISESILKIFGSTAIDISGVSWLPKGESKGIAVNDFSSKILCQRHNNALSGLDSIAQKFFSVLLGHSQDQWAAVISGYEVERWMLKTLVNLWQSGNLLYKGIPVETKEVPLPFLRTLFYSDPIPSGFGLACATEDVEYVQFNKAMIRALFHENTGLLGWEFYLGFIRLLFFIQGPINSIPRDSDSKKGLIFHPSVIIIRQSGGQREVHLGWPENNAFIVEVDDIPGQG